MFREKIREHVAWVAEMLENYPDIANIEARTKSSLIEPLLRCLGYDPIDPGQVEREAVIRGKKVDYMLTGEKGANVAVEAKPAKTTLSEKEIDQLDTYFHHSEAVAGVLTNGVDCWLFTDLEKTNVMDSQPYRKVNINQLKNNDIDNLETLTRSSVSQGAVHQQAKQEQYRALVNEIVTQELNSPSQDFLRLVGKKAEIKPLSKPNLTMLKPLVGEAICRHLGVESASKPKPSSSPPDEIREPPQISSSPTTPSSSLNTVSVPGGGSSSAVKFGRATLFGEVLPAKSYPQMLVAVVAELQTRHPNEFPDRVLNEEDFKGRQWWFISKDLSDLSPRLRKVKVGEYYVNVNFNRQGSVKQAQRFLSAFGYGAKVLEIRFSDDLSKEG